MAGNTQLDLKSILLEGSYISPSEALLAEQKSQKKKISFVDYLFSEGLIDKDVLGQAIAEHYGVPYADLNTQIPSREQILMIPETLAKKYNLVMFKVVKDKLVIATDHPNNQPAITELKNFFKGKKLALAYSLEEDIKKIFRCLSRTDK